MDMLHGLIALLALLLLAEEAVGRAARTADQQPGAAELVEALSGEDAVARLLAEQQLVQMGDRALPALEPLAMSPGYSPARQHAIHIVARIGSPAAVRLLLRTLEDEHDVRARGLVCRHIGRMGIEEAVPIIGRWLTTIRGKPVDFGGGDRWGNPRVKTRSYAWVLHVHALREIGSEKGVPILEQMLKRPHGGKAGRSLTRAYGEALTELRREAAFWKALRRLPGAQKHARILFSFFRKDTLALIRLYRDKVIRLGVEGRWVLESMADHPNFELRRAATALLKEYGRLGGQP